MFDLLLIKSLSKWIFIVAAISCLAFYFTKDSFPDPDFYGGLDISEPKQYKTNHPSFTTEVEGQTYHIKPLFDYELRGMVVSLHDADDFLDISHHKSWQDFINLRDFCVIWGDNLEKGLYQKMDFENDSWTCWFSTKDRATWNAFHMDGLSNNHILADDEWLRETIKTAEHGDFIQFSGYLVEYQNPANQFNRGTSTVRTDTGNGACETIYLTNFRILRKANKQLRMAYGIIFWVMLLAGFGFIFAYLKSPFRGHGH